MGIKTIKLPRKTVRMASHQLMPPPIREDASMYVGIHADIEIHKAAKLASPHFLRSHGTGARSSLYSEPARAASSAETSNAGIASIFSWVARSVGVHVSENCRGRLCR